MTRRHLALFGGVLLFCGAAINAPASTAEAAAVTPAATRPIADTLPLSIRLGDGIVSLRIQLCDQCGAHVTFEINLAPFIAAPVNHHRSAA